MADDEKILLDFLTKVLNNRGYKQREIYIKEITTKGNSYTSALFSINVQTSDKELKLFAKVAKIGKQMRELTNAEKMFKTESFIYNKLINLYNNLQKNLSEEHKFIFPEFYGFNNHYGKETFILENLIESGYTPYDGLKSMNWEHGRVGVECLARFHSLSFALKKSDPKNFEEIAKFLEFRSRLDMTNGSVKKQFIEMVEKKVKDLKQEHRDKVTNIMYKPDWMKHYKQPISVPVLAHGDYRLNNILYKQKGNNLTAVVVDYQTVHTGCPVADLVYFIFMGSDENFRRLYYEKLINHYYKSLEEALKKLYVDPVEVYPRENFDGDLQEFLPTLVRTAVVVMPTILAEPESVPKWDSDEADFSTWSLDTGALYIERFRGIINDLVNWGVI